MKLSQMRVALFSGASVAALQTDINKFLNGEAVVGPPAFAIGFVSEKELLSIHYAMDGATFTALIAYTE